MHRIIHQTIVIFVFLFLSSFLNTLLKASANGEYSTFALRITSGLYPRSSLVKYYYLSNSLEDSADILAASLIKSY